MDKDEYHRAVARLRQRSTAELADFVASLLFGDTTGVGVYARAFAAADSQAATRIIGDAIGCGGHFLRHDRYHQARGAAQRRRGLTGPPQRAALRPCPYVPT